MKQRLTAVALAILLLISFAACGYVADKVLDRFPNSGDEYAYLFQARTFLEGRLWNKPYPDAESFFTWHIIQKDGKMLAKYPPGWPLILAAGMKVGIPYWLVNPVLGMLLIFSLFHFARRFYGPSAAWLTVLSLTLSSFYLFNSASLFAHPFCALALVVFAYFALDFLETRRLSSGVLACAFLGAVFLARPYTALLAALPFVIHRRLWSFKGFAALLLGLAPFIALHLLYNHRITGDPFLSPFQWYDAKDHPFSGIHNFTSQIALKNLKKLTVLFLSWTNPLLAVFFLIYLIAALKQRKLKAPDLIFPALMLGHLPYWGDGVNQYGPRYYYEGYPFLVTAAASGLFAASNKFLRGTLFAVFLAGGALAAERIPRHAAIEHQVVMERQDPYHLVKKENLRNAVVILAAVSCPTRPFAPSDLTRNDFELNNDVLFALNWGAAKNQELQNLFPNREFYTYRRPRNSPEGHLQKGL